MEHYISIIGYRQSLFWSMGGNCAIGKRLAGRGHSKQELVRWEFADVLREHNVSLALTDTSFVPRSWETKEKFDLATADFAYVRRLGDRK
jgi:hypothetical protein